MAAGTATADSFQELEQFLQDTLERSQFSLSTVTLSGQSEWHLRGGALSHRTGGFFHVTGLANRARSEEHLVLYQPQGALTGLALCRSAETVLLLLQARVEPGNSGVCQYGPTIQSTPANYLGLHAGRRTPCLDLFNTHQPGVRPLATSMQLDLGRRYFHKSKTHSYVELPAPIETDPNMIWASLPVLAEALTRDNFLNADLRSLLSVLDWDRLLRGVDSPKVAAVPTDLCASFLAGNHPAGAAWELIPLDRLRRWKVCEEGIVDTAGAGLSVSLYRTSCTNREVLTWVQPLVRSAGRGLVALLFREGGRGPEFLVSVASEFGISGGSTIHPSRVVYPGESVDRQPAYPERGVVVAEFVQSDEGGRFHRHESTYQLVRVEGEWEPGDGQHWVSAGALKALLGTSNTLSFQLRCITSLALGILNPLSFGGSGVSWPSSSGS